jgi:hypothetical protein
VCCEIVFAFEGLLPFSPYVSGKHRMKEDSNIRESLLVLYAVTALKGLKVGEHYCSAHWHREQTLKLLSEVKSPMLALHSMQLLAVVVLLRIKGTAKRERMRKRLLSRRAVTLLCSPVVSAEDDRRNWTSGLKSAPYTGPECAWRRE